VLLLVLRVCCLSWRRLLLLCSIASITSNMRRLRLWLRVHLHGSGRRGLHLGLLRDVGHLLLLL
jgi:hypothetical protein